LVTHAEPKKRMGHGGKLAFSINFVRLKDDEKAAVRSSRRAPAQTVRRERFSHCLLAKK